MVEFAYIVMILFMILSPFVFWIMSVDRTLLLLFLVSLLALPQITIPLPFLTSLSHFNLPTLCSIAGIVISGTAAQSRLSLNALDIPIVFAGLCPMMSSLTNGLGLYDGFHSGANYFLHYTVPFLLGRAFLSTPDGSRLLARSFIFSAILYIPPSLIEIRLSPQLHNWIYGAGSQWGGMRLGGYRPSVFMENGLQFGIWMSGCTFVAVCCFFDPFKSPGKTFVNTKTAVTLFLVNLLCRSTGALTILLSGMAAMLPVRLLNSRVGLICLVLISPIYISTRLSGVWDGKVAVSFSADIDKDRAQSFEFRLENEDILMKKAMERPVFGWGGWNRARVLNENGKDISVTDGRWIIMLGNHGLAGLFCDYWALLMPLIAVILRWPTVLSCRDNSIVVVSMSALCAMWAFDFLSNNFPNPIYWLCAGAISGAGTLASVPESPSNAGDAKMMRRPRRSLQFSHRRTGG